MKSKKLRSIAACGLGCALAMSMSPAAAFAADMDGTQTSTDVTTIEDLSTDSDASTEVNVFGSDSQISVTVPVALTLAVNGAPAAAFAGVPTNYTIQNDSYFDVQVKKVKATETDAWDYSDAKITTSTSISTDKTGAIHVDLYPGVADGNGKTTGGVAITKAGVDTSTGSAATKWKVPAKKSADTPSTLAIGINGNTKLDSALASDSTSASTATTLVYTIGRAS